MFYFRRGIPAQPLLNGYCGNYELGMPKSLINYPAFNYENPDWTSSTTSATATATSTNPSSVSSKIFNYRIHHIIYTILFLLFVFRFHQK